MPQSKKLMVIGILDVAFGDHCTITLDDETHVQSIRLTFAGASKPAVLAELRDKIAAMEVRPRKQILHHHNQAVNTVTAALGKLRRHIEQAIESPTDRTEMFTDDMPHPTMLAGVRIMEAPPDDAQQVKDEKYEGRIIVSFDSLCKIVVDDVVYSEQLSMDFGGGSVPAVLEGMYDWLRDMKVAPRDAKRVHCREGAEKLKSAINAMLGIIQEYLRSGSTETKRWNEVKVPYIVFAGVRKV